jgi:hypothetical protein
MRRSCAALLFFLTCWQSCPAAAAEGTKLRFDTYSGYFVSNKFEPDAAASFLVVTSQKQFDKVFGVATVMGDKSHRLPKDLFKSSIILTAIKRGPAVWEFKIESVKVDRGVVKLHYTTTAQKSDSATFACPLILSIPSGKYVAVHFIENRKPVRVVKLGER